jgi:antitoxin Phd
VGATWRYLYRFRRDLYALGMTTLNISNFRANLPGAIETAKTEAVILERNGRPAAVMVSPERYAELMDALEEQEDVAAVDAALAEGGEPIPWEQVMKDLGWIA